MSNWLTLPLEERRVMLQVTAEREHIPEYAVEKDWWVSVILKALFNLECSKYLLFKGGTSLSKGWKLIERFSEDVDIALSHRFFDMPTDNNNQIKNLRKACRKYIITDLSQQLRQELEAMGLKGFVVEAKSVIDGQTVSSDADPTVIDVCYTSIVDEQSMYVPARVKVEISCLSMDVPHEEKHITTLISSFFPDIDSDTDSNIPTVVPSRTFLEKAFLLCEEFQKAAPRSLRMSRHLYDLERLMDTPFADEALRDKELYEMVVEHRRKFYHVGYADYDKDYPQFISILPPDDRMSEWRRDYDELVKSFVYGEYPSFKHLIERIKELQNRFRATND